MQEYRSQDQQEWDFGDTAGTLCTGLSQFSTSTVPKRTGEHAQIEKRLINPRTSGCIRVSK